MCLSLSLFFIYRFSGNKVLDELVQMKTKTTVIHILITIPIYNGKTSRCINWDQSCWPIHTSFTLESHGSCIKKTYTDECVTRGRSLYYTVKLLFSVFSLCDGTTVKSITCAISNLWCMCMIKIMKKSQHCVLTWQKSYGYWCWQYSTDSHMMLAFRRAVWWWRKCWRVQGLMSEKFV